MSEAADEITLGTFYFKHIAEDFLRQKQRDYPGRVVELREVAYDWSRSVYWHVVLRVNTIPLGGEHNGSTGGQRAVERRVLE